MSKTIVLRRQSGFTLIEVLVSVLILAFGLLGIGAMMGITMKSNNSSYLKQQSIQAAYNIIDRMQSNKSAAMDGSYNMNNLVASSAKAIPPPSPKVDCQASNCTTTQMAIYDVYIWVTNELQKLPNGCASVVVGAANANGNYPVTVTVQWDDSPVGNLGTATHASIANSDKILLSRVVTETLL